MSPRYKTLLKQSYFPNLPLGCALQGEVLWPFTVLAPHCHACFVGFHLHSFRFCHEPLLWELIPADIGSSPVFLWGEEGFRPHMAVLRIISGSMLGITPKGLWKLYKTRDIKRMASICQASALPAMLSLCFPLFKPFFFYFGTRPRYLAVLMSCSWLLAQ